MNFLFKSSVFLVSSLFFRLGCANENSPMPANYRGSFYVGGFAGPSMYDGNYIAQQGINTLFFESGIPTLNVGGCIGVDGKYDFLYGALEGSAVYDSLDHILGIFTSPSGVPNHIVKAKNSILGNFIGKLGFYANDSVFYVLGGITGGRWTLGLENDSAIAYNRGIQPQSSMFFNHNLLGPKLGGGVRIPLYEDRIFLDMQYSYSWYGNLGVTLRDLGTDKVWTHTISNEQQAVLFSLNLALYDL